MNPQQPNSYEIVLGPHIKVTEDKRTGSKIANFPFEFPDGKRGVLIVLRLSKERWEPDETIKNITIEFNESTSTGATNTTQGRRAESRRT